MCVDPSRRFFRIANVSSLSNISSPLGSVRHKVCGGGPNYLGSPLGLDLVEAVQRLRQLRVAPAQIFQFRHQVGENRSGKFKRSYFGHQFH